MRTSWPPPALPLDSAASTQAAEVRAETVSACAGGLQDNREMAAAELNADVIPLVAYTDPEVAGVGLTQDQAKAQSIKAKKGLFLF